MGDNTRGLQEPENLKNSLLSMWLEIGRVRLGNTGIDADSPDVWRSIDGLGEYLWDAWKNSLSKKGFTKRKFFHLMRYRTDDLLLWAYNRTTWGEFVDRIISSIEGPIGRDIVQGTGRY